MQKEVLKQKLEFLYKDKADKLFEDLIKLMDSYKDKINNTNVTLSEKDSILITYADTLKSPTPLKSLLGFYNNNLKNVISGMHVLPFFPYSSDGGFSIKDFKEVDPKLGTWGDIEDISKETKLMVDFVLNHCSSEHEWFQKFLEGDEYYEKFFHVYEDVNEISKEQLHKVRRPRTTPLLSEFETKKGKRYVWTTFSKDQIDLNWENPEVFLEMIDTLLFYVQKGAKIIRLDAITYLWDKLGTESASIPQDHAVVQILRDVLDVVAKDVIIITETNVEYGENISYLSEHEAQMVYDFGLPTMVLYSFLKQDSKKLTEWLTELNKVNGMMFNMLDTHDGIGLANIQGILSVDEIEVMVKAVEERKGKITYKSTPEGKKPYEMNITWWSAINGEDETDIALNRYVASRAIALALKGLPAIYVQGLFATKNDYSNIDTENGGVYRNINRHNINEVELNKFINGDSYNAKVFKKLTKLLAIRSQHKAFSPDAGQEILNLTDKIVAIVRKKDDEMIFALTNITNKEQPIELDKSMIDLLTNQKMSSWFILQPYQTMWLN